MLFRHLRTADLPALESALLDQSRRMVIRRIAEYRTCIGQIQRLRADTLGQQGLDLLPCALSIARLEVQPGTDEKLEG